MFSRLGLKVGSVFAAASACGAGAWAQGCRPGHDYMGMEHIRAYLGAATAHADAAAPVALNPQEWRSFKLQSKKKINHNTIEMQFALQSPDHVAGLSVASCLIVRAAIGSINEDGSHRYVIRPYTPISDPSTKGHFTLLVKVYEQGNMSKHMGNMNEGSELEVKGPIPKLPYEANMRKSIGMIAGGSGITPMLQIAEEILRNKEDTTQVSLVYANVTQSDILLQGKLDELASKHDNFRVHYVVEKPDWWGLPWRGSVGRVTKDVIAKHCPSPSDDNLLVVCGPPPMMNAISGDKNPDKTQGEVQGILAEMGYTRDQVYKM